MESRGASADMGSDNNASESPSWDTEYHVSGLDSQIENSPQGRIYERENIQRSIGRTNTTPITRHRMCAATVKTTINKSTTRQSEAAP